MLRRHVSTCFAILAVVAVVVAPLLASRGIGVGVTNACAAPAVAQAADAEHGCCSKSGSAGDAAGTVTVGQSLSETRERGGSAPCCPCGGDVPCECPGCFRTVSSTPMMIGFDHAVSLSPVSQQLALIHDSLPERLSLGVLIQPPIA